VRSASLATMEKQSAVSLIIVSVVE